ncbi:MAG: CDF family Co(II)/Ni(II) efflux transporter DmeF [Acinetobacter ursingii]|uniref:CDF family Co(II)/Ni(II) efflux transporter DmeF n=1 Tax=Acinetobacter ursingii TaxID=108980 RepID=A0AA46S3F5_9GAMM|nr:CDF family Co(II)/Ni(II) efflux transporter DmeF [Acinetobacter ursingii]MCU4490250.1 CDF family Co(II)/Ni(II) efflux transporter DmeF [Acinetobacter ursingii]MCU4602572.1 CDF family Co(II)/Ni(II) efflux transporter DmeF [Acinetobacter ursingii]MDH0191588.1 CDF family Co(II)/Ni(II) efflux transporter DmeF [Acinetobacter ursingii]PPZ94668.1 cation transporter [Acinetobacter ursingii]UYF71141.1 CDF family Co(II)/Ni(II) efflux transporter DmeF [Acinetobacter ursingii]
MTNNILLDQHHHQFDKGNPLAQKKILWATILTGVMMIAEISGGMIFNSMALLADGWHMSSHMVALGLAYLAYRAARYYSADSRFCFGSWKIEVLVGYSSAILLMVVAIVMGFSSIERLFNPVIIYYNDAIGIAVVGLMVNLVCAWLLHDDHSDHHHSHHHSEHEHSHGHDHQDLNQKAAFIHVVADAATSVLAIIALFAGKYFGWNFLDAVLGIIGAILVAKWSWGLIRQTGKILLDAEMQEPVVEEIKQVIEQFDSMIKLMDLHVWQVGKGKFSCILSLQTSNQFLTPQAIKQALSIHEEIVHASIEINLIH